MILLSLLIIQKSIPNVISIFKKIRFFSKIWIELILCNESMKILVNILYVFFPASHRLKKSLKSNAQILRELGHHCGCGDEIYKLRMIRKQSVSEIFRLVTQSHKSSVFSLMVLVRYRMIILPYCHAMKS